MTSGTCSDDTPILDVQTLKYIYALIRKEVKYYEEASDEAAANGEIYKLNRFDHMHEALKRIGRKVCYLIKNPTGGLLND